MKKITVVAFMLFPLVSHAMPPQAFNFSCGKAGGIYSDGKGGVWIDGEKLSVKQTASLSWEAIKGKVVVSIARATDGNPEITVSDPGRTHEACLPDDYASFAPAEQKASGEQSGPSFSCNNVTKDSMEALICQNATLSDLDFRLAKVYKTALAKNPRNKALKAEQRGWIKGRDECWKEYNIKACLAYTYRQRIVELQCKYDEC